MARLRRMLQESGVSYVLAVPTSQPVPALGRIDLVIAQAPDEAWEQHSSGTEQRDLASTTGPRQNRGRLITR
jgi:hypothetical protein